MLAAVVVAALALVPLGFVAYDAAAVGPREAYDLLWRPRIGELLWNTVRLVVGGMLACAVVGVGCAWLVERTDLPLRRLWHALLVAPLAVPAFVTSFGWVSLTSSVQTYAGAVLVVTLAYYPLVYLPAVVTLRGLDPALEETAQALGHGRLAVFVRVVLPQLRPALLGGSLLVGLHLLAEFGAIQMLRFPTFTTAIYDQYRSTFNGGAATMTASVLVLCCLLLLLTELRLRGRRRYARLSAGSARPADRQRLGRWTPVGLLAAVGVVALAVGVPTYALVHWLVVGSSTAFPVADLLAATGTSLALGAAGAAITVVLAAPVAWLAVRHRGRLAGLLEGSTYVSTSLPGIVIALALVTASLRIVPDLYQTYALLLSAYAVLFLPRAVVSLRAAIEQAPPVLDDVARSLGTSPLETIRRVTLPLIAPGVASGAALVFLAVSTELTATLMLAPIDVATLATRFWSASSSVAYGAAAPYALLMVLISLPATVLLGRVSAGGGDR